ncbi:MAG: DUF3822 family protein [Bacteroidales bacterium]|jgi:hypothetical protein|nr:DUF3822 family protein [Bacteroidales bacterium]
MPHKLDINIEPAQTTLVPKKIFNSEWSQAFAELNFEFDSKSQIVLSETYNDIVFLSVVDKKMYNSATAMFPTGEFFSTYRLLFHAFEKLAHSDKRNRHQIFVNITPKSFDLFVFEKKHKLIFANTFAYQSSNDFLYYLLHVVNRLKIDTGGLTLKVIDSTDNSEELMTVLDSHFLSVVKLLGKENPLNLRVHIQPGLSLINPALCE